MSRLPVVNFKTMEVPLERIAPPPELWGRGDTRSGLGAPSLAEIPAM
jgi:hypothetical protein